MFLVEPLVESRAFWIFIRSLRRSCTLMATREATRIGTNYEGAVRCVARFNPRSVEPSDGHRA